MKVLNFLILLLLTFMTTHIQSAVWNSESGPGNGTDYVKVLFANARSEAIEILNDISSDTIDHLEVDDYLKEWLLEDIEGSPRYIKLKFYASEFTFKFQDEACPEENSICFYKNPSALIVVSLTENSITTEKQAVTMLLHEIGHFTGEYDHLFLDRFATELVKISSAPFVVVEKINKRYVSQIFEASNHCERGQGEQADALKKQIEFALLEKCAKRKIQCFKKDIVYSFSAELPTLGMGFNSTAICMGKGLLKGKRILTP